MRQTRAPHTCIRVILIINIDDLASDPGRARGSEAMPRVRLGEKKERGCAKWVLGSNSCGSFENDCINFTFENNELYSLYFKDNVRGMPTNEERS